MIKEWIGPELPERPIAHVRKSLRGHAYQFLIPMACILGFMFWSLEAGSYDAVRKSIYCAALWSVLTVLRVYTDINQILYRLYLNEDFAANRADKWPGMERQ